MATAKRKQEELGDECDDHEAQDNDPCSDDDEAKRPRLDVHHQQHLQHHQMHPHRQWSLEEADTGDQKLEPSEAPCVRESVTSEVTDDREVDVDSENNDLNSASTRSLDDKVDNERDYPKRVNYEVKDDRNVYDQLPIRSELKFHYPSSSNDNYGTFNNYYFSAYPDHYIPRSVEKEVDGSVEDSPCDLSNWHLRSNNKFENNMAENERELAIRCESIEREQDNQQGDNKDGNENNTEQPINFAYYHF